MILNLITFANIYCFCVSFSFRLVFRFRVHDVQGGENRRGLCNFYISSREVAFSNRKFLFGLKLCFLERCAKFKFIKQINFSLSSSSKSISSACFIKLPDVSSLL